MATSNPASDIPQSKARYKLTAAEKSEITKTVLPYAVAILAQLPLLFLYYKLLWTLPHYSSWFLFAMLATAVLTWTRWPKDGRQMFMESMWSNLLAIAGVIFGLMGVLFVEPWFAALSVFTLITSLLARTIDRDTGRSLWVVALPLFISLRLPAGKDVDIITWLQTMSAFLTSRLLDLVGIGHHMPGTVIETPDRSYGVEEACSGIQSFFLLIFVAVAFCVWMRRPLFRSLLLFVAAMVWSIFMNCLRIFLIPVFDYFFDIDLVSGFQHELLGWLTMALGIFLLLSTDQFLMFLFGPVDVGTGSSGPLGKFITGVWNNLVSGGQDDEETNKRRRSRREPLTALSRGVAWAAAGLLLVAGLVAILDIVNSFNAQTRITFFSRQVIYPLKQTSMPESIEDWTQLYYQSNERKSASDLGQQSDVWQYRSPKRFVAIVSLDQTFPGWHELTRCYRNQGWILEDRVRHEVISESADGDEESDKQDFWPYVEARFSKPTGESGILLFCLFDGEGHGFDPPREWSAINYILSGAKNRLGQRIRARLFQSEAYQAQVFLEGYGEISPEVSNEMTARFLEVREILRKEFLATKFGSSPDLADASGATAE